MALSLFAPKALAAEVTAGIDLESRVVLSGERVTVGSGSGDSLRLGARGVVPAHLIFQRAKGAKGWEYFTSDRGHTAVDRGNPRAGAVRPGMKFVLGGESRIEIVRTEAPAGQKDTAPSTDAKTVPLAVAVPVMALMVAASVFALRLRTGNDGTDDDLVTTAWFVGRAELAPALDACLEAGLSPEARALGTAAVPGDADALFRAALAADAVTLPPLRTDLAAKVSGIIAETHLLAHEGRALDASRSLRRLENVLPVGNGDCPILRAARMDLAILELMGNAN